MGGGSYSGGRGDPGGKAYFFSPLVPESTIFVLGLGERASSGVANKLRERFCLKEIFTVPVLSWGKKELQRMIPYNLKCHRHSIGEGRC